MMLLVIGGSGSGKSAYAEQALLSLAKGQRYRHYYLATMQPQGREAQERIARHRALRAGKGFLTLEQPVDIQESLQRMEAGNRTALLECISNLAANEMFSGGQAAPPEQVSEKIIREIAKLRESVTHLAVVSNNVFEDGGRYPQETMEYLQAMGWVNQALAQMADQVIEVAAGIPLPLKGAECI